MDDKDPTQGAEQGQVGADVGQRGRPERSRTAGIRGTMWFTPFSDTPRVLVRPGRAGDPAKGIADDR
ncbi:MAG: hypothetical protein AVDCRST_MAG19-2509 [uncultured Thermomicrobiales bacterium]|uniref:Uncharacterized protein n=1 Tax=uncultured Thermomicrobiales bacterium TaxID=1645740 RepID=A0A6J4V8Q9_9BACT|nr:MAG: hypothetical protein AVDCRST_MAG19-2509 [uncultured Thermomicrobiales bacterium]